MSDGRHRDRREDHPRNGKETQAVRTLFANGVAIAHRSALPLKSSWGKAGAFKPTRAGAMRRIARTHVGPVLGYLGIRPASSAAVFFEQNCELRTPLTAILGRKSGGRRQGANPDHVILDRLDARNVLDRHADRLSEALVVKRTAEFDDAIVTLDR